jgi:hypothetical protein
MVVFVLFLFTSAYAVQVGTFPNAMTCAMAAVQMAESFDRPPKAFLYRLACVPAIKALPAVLRAPPPDMGPGA